MKAVKLLRYPGVSISDQERRYWYDRQESKNIYMRELQKGTDRETEQVPSMWQEAHNNARNGD